MALFPKQADPPEQNWAIIAPRGQEERSGSQVTGR
jgi:hypothetical protein